MDGTGPQRPLGESQFDRDIESALSIEPSPEFLARARARIAAEPEPSRWRLAYVVSAFRRTAMDPLWGVAIAGIVLAIVVPQWIHDGKPTVTVTDRRPVERPPTSDGSEIGEAAIGGGTGRVGVAAIVPTRSASRIQRRPPGTPEVLISQDDQRAFDALLIAVAENRLPVRTTPVEEAVSSLAIAPLQIQQLSIEPLRLTGLEGVNGS